MARIEWRAWTGRGRRRLVVTALGCAGLGLLAFGILAVVDSDSSKAQLPDRLRLPLISRDRSEDAAGPTATNTPTSTATTGPSSAASPTQGATPGTTVVLTPGVTPTRSTGGITPTAPVNGITPTVGPGITPTPIGGPGITPTPLAQSQR